MSGLHPGAKGPDIRRRAGMDDVELRGKTGGLHVGDSVGLTFLAALKAFAGETLLARITRIRGRDFGASR